MRHLQFYSTYFVPSGHPEMLRIWSINFWNGAQVSCRKLGSQFVCSTVPHNVTIMRESMFRLLNWKINIAQSAGLTPLVILEMGHGNLYIQLTTSSNRLDLQHLALPSVLHCGVSQGVCDRFSGVEREPKNVWLKQERYNVHLIVYHWAVCLQPFSILCTLPTPVKFQSIPAKTSKKKPWSLIHLLKHLATNCYPFATYLDLFIHHFSIIVSIQGSQGLWFNGYTDNYGGK